MDQSFEPTPEIDEDPRAALTVLMAEQFHAAGITTDRLEAMLAHMAGVLGLELHAFLLPTNITLAIGPSYRQKVVMLRVSPEALDLTRIAKLTEVYDAVCNGAIDASDALKSTKTIIAAAKSVSPFVVIGAYCLVSVGAAIVLGAYPREVIVATLIGLSTGTIAAIASRYALVARLFEVLAVFVGTMIVAAFTRFAGPTNLYISIVAGIVPLLPGYSLTSALYELANADLVAGVARLGKVFATVLALGCGAALAIAVVGTSVLASSNQAEHGVGILAWTAALGLMTVGLAALLSARLKDYVWIFGACFIALLSLRVLSGLPAHQTAPFGAAFISGLVSSFGARFLRVPQVVLLAPAVFVLVPGSLTYESVFYLFQQNYSSAAALGVNAILASIFIVAGLLLSQLIFATGSIPFRAIRRFGPR